MARRRGKGGAGQSNPASNPSGLGVGALASQPLQHGERSQLEALTPPTPQAPQGPQPGGQPQGQPIPMPDVDLMAPTQRPDEPLTAGMPLGPGPNGPPNTILEADIDEQIRVAYEASGYHPDLRRLLEGRR